MEPKLPDLPPPDVVLDTHPFGVADDAFSGEAMRSHGSQCYRMGMEAAARMCDEDAKEFSHPMKRAGAEACAIRLRAAISREVP